VPTHVAWEVVVVDNASTDNTRQVARQEWNACGGKAPFQVVDQPEAGLSNARQKGIDAARYEYLLFCDDDNWLSQDYVRTAYQIMEANPKIGALGGYGMPECEIEPPDWMQPFIKSYAVGPQREKNGSLETGGVVYGAGSVYRKAGLLNLTANGFRSLLSDREGEKLTSGGDFELCYALTLAGYEIWYDERLVFRHFIPRERMTWNYVVKNYKGFVQAEPVLRAYQLAIDTFYCNRKRFKNTWQWLFLMQTRFLLKNLMSSGYLMFRNNQKEAWLSSYRAVQNTLNVYVHRKKFSDALYHIENSRWVKRAR
jgi:glycosyltransferase involved in cell wall biosynthesis